MPYKHYPEYNQPMASGLTMEERVGPADDLSSAFGHALHAYSSLQWYVDMYIERLAPHNPSARQSTFEAKLGELAALVHANAPGRPIRERRA